MLVTMPTPAPGSSRPDARVRLLEAARAAFAEKGFHGTTTRDIAAAAGMSPAAIYVHHRTKESLLHELSLDGHRAAVEAVQLATRGVADPAEALRAWVTAFVTGQALGHTTARIVNYELEALTPQHRGDVDQLRSQIQDCLIKILERGCQARVFVVEDTHVAANAIAGMGVDVSRWFRDDAGTSPTQLAREFGDLAVRMVRA